MSGLFSRIAFLSIALPSLLDAAEPSRENSESKSASRFTKEDRQWWAFRPVEQVKPPASGDGWALHDIDRFIAAKQLAAGLPPRPRPAGSR